MNDQHSEQDHTGARSQDRNSLLMKARIHVVARGVELEARIRNLSAGGLMAEAAIQIANGDKVEVELRNVGWTPGRVAWTADGRFGIAFDHPVNPGNVRVPVGQNKPDLPHYLERLNRAQRPKIRRV